MVLPRIFALLLLVTAAGLAACGKKGDPIEPEDVTLTYPREYPTTR
ncbi:MAG: lipoprotein [Alphaproteobacteria bacterium]